MNRQQWKSPLSKLQAFKRASGRRRINARRSNLAGQRRLKLIELVKVGLPNAEIARRLDVHRSTITRDLEADLYLQILALPRKLNRLMKRMDRIK